MKTAHQYEERLTPCQVSCVYKLIGPLLDDKAVLDIGCSTGDYLERFSRASVGLDYSEPNLAICREKGLTVEKADFNEPLPFRDGSYDVTFCSHVLEHVDSPINLLREMHRLLKPGGKSILAVPVERSVVRCIMRDSYFGGHPTHLYSFSHDCLRRLLETAGFTVECVILDLPLLKRLNSLALLRLVQLLPKKLGMMVAGNVWVVSGKKG
jgi:SAM-dependent methyltransferase